MNEWEMCFTYDQDKINHECIGASGRKFRRVCVLCPNYLKYRARLEREDAAGSGDLVENEGERDESCQSGS